VYLGIANLNALAIEIKKNQQKLIFQDPKFRYRLLIEFTTFDTEIISNLYVSEQTLYTAI